MTQAAIRPTRIVVAVDGSEYAAGVVEYALDIACRFAAAELHFLRVVEPRGRTLRDREGQLDGAHQQVGELIHEALVDLGNSRDRSGWSVRVHALVGDPADEVLGMAADVEADLIVLGRWGSQQPHRDRLGSIGGGIVAGARCPVLLAQPTDYGASEHRDSCDECVAVRRETRGERWFCAAHSGEKMFRSTSVIAAAFTPTGGASQF